MSLFHISQQTAIYNDFVLLFTVIVRNFIKVLAFSTVHTVLYILFCVGLILHKILYILINPIHRNITGESEINLIFTSIFLCKIRRFFMTTLSLISVICSYQFIELCSVIIILEIIHWILVFFNNSPIIDICSSICFKYIVSHVHYKRVNSCHKNIQICLISIQLLQFPNIQKMIIHDRWK